MKITRHLFSVALLGLLFTACKQTDFKKTKDGFPYKLFSDGKGEKVQPGYFISYYRTDKIKDSVLETSYGSAPQFLPIPKDTSAGNNPLVELLLGARKGDSLQINQPVDTILRRNPQAAQDPFLSSKKGQSIVTIFKIVDVYKSEADAVAAFEKQNLEMMNKQPEISAQRKKDEGIIEEYLRANNVQTQRTPWGAYVQIVQPGTGEQAKSGQFMMLRYTGKNLQGKEFDSNNKPGAELMPFQVGGGRMIPGFADAVKTLREGAKANIYLPSVIAYGAQGSPPAIQPNENIMFEVEVVDITDQRPAPAAPPTQQLPDSSRRQ